jgi:predicted transcriptional regulator
LFLAASPQRPIGGYRTITTMTTKEKAIRVIQSLDDDVSLDDVIDRLYLLRKIELGIAQADAGEVLEHDRFMDELEAEDAQ